MSESPRLVELRNRHGYKPDLGSIARGQVASARERLGLTHAEFAELLTPLLGWEPSAHAVESWETGTTPPGDVLVAASLATHTSAPGERTDAMDIVSQLMGDRFADLSAIYMTRSDFASEVSLTELLDNADTIDAVGISLNLLCQQYPDRNLRAVLERGATLRCLFLDPASEAVKTYEDEEGYIPGQISALTELNIQAIVKRVRDRMPIEAQARLQVATYNETSRFNLLIVDHQVCVMQPYFPHTRGIDSPTFMINRQTLPGGLFPIFEQVFETLWERGTRL
ncbi:DUF5919 domain-containing protein [Tenggerimyces flavus]|uniref:DUF5919 domain-containing protein n=1 Tax=Tenggerimyces flavus TaxID=1708749 RepID=A0ABV7Y9T8_9ACTN|nr:DUF5919 domain-containing protein [Tenggerimyces flavus]MBM7783563.1 hypothetical protein [Tenggerimyces flavus]